MYGAFLAFQPADRVVAIEADDKEVAQVARLAQVVDMAAVDEVEAAIGEDNLEWFVFLSSQHSLHVEDDYHVVERHNLEVQSGVEAAVHFSGSFLSLVVRNR